MADIGKRSFYDKVKSKELMFKFRPKKVTNLILLLDL